MDPTTILKSEAIHHSINVMSKHMIVFSFALLFAGCPSLAVDSYKPNGLTYEALSRANGDFSAGSVSGISRVESDALLKSSLPCRLTSFDMPEHQPVALYIENALKAELQAGEKLAHPEGRRIDIVVAKLESDTSKIRNGRWTIEFQYKISKVVRTITTTTDYAFDADSTVACRNTADAFDDALRTNFNLFFQTLK